MLRAADLGLRVELVPLVMTAMNIVYALSSYPAGYLSDHMDRWHLLALGFAVLVAADLVLAMSGSIGVAFIGVALWACIWG